MKMNGAASLPTLPNSLMYQLRFPKLIDLIKIENHGFISIELCPDRHFEENKLREIRPLFCSIPWLGRQTHDLKEIPALRLAQHLCSVGYNVVLHLAGRHLNNQMALQILKEAQKIGVRNILALQGDPVDGWDDTTRPFRYASDLVKFIRYVFDDYFCIGVAGYPYVWPSESTRRQDLFYLKQKVYYGANFIITQGFFEEQVFLNFTENCGKYDINIPIIPGLFMFGSFKTLTAVSKYCHVPIKLMRTIEKYKNNDEVGTYCVQLTKHLVKTCISSAVSRNSIIVVHIFTLNNLDLVHKLNQAL